MVCPLVVVFCSKIHTNRVVAKCQTPTNTQNTDTATEETVISVEVPARPMLAATGANVLFAGMAGIVLAVLAGAVVVSRRRS